MTRLEDAVRRRDEMVGERLGERVVCTRCGATWASYEERCSAALDDPCPGFMEIDAVMLVIERALGLSPS